MTVVTTGQVAKICKVAPRTVSKWFDSGRLKGYRIPGSQDRRIPREYLSKFLKEPGMPLGALEDEAMAKSLVVAQAQDLIQSVKPELPKDHRCRCATADSGFIVNKNGTISIPASALLANDTDPNGLPLSITGVSNLANGNGTVSYNASTQTVIFTPTAGFTGTASFSYSIGDSSGASASGNVALLVNDPSSQNLFSLTAVPGQVNVNDPSSVELGVKFSASANGTIGGIRFYKGSLNIGTHVADLWSSTGTLLATATFTNESASGWQQVNFSSPVTITAGTTYIASYHPSGIYAADLNYFTTTLTLGQLTAPANTNGVHACGSGSIFPTGTFNARNYWVDVL